MMKMMKMKSMVITFLGNLYHIFITASEQIGCIDTTSILFRHVFKIISNIDGVCFVNDDWCEFKGFATTEWTIRLH